MTASYHLLQTQPLPPASQQRKALTFTFLIVMVAFATLLTIIRFTLNPNLFGQTVVQPPKSFLVQSPFREQYFQQNANAHSEKQSDTGRETKANAAAAVVVVDGAIGSNQLADGQTNLMLAKPTSDNNSSQDSSNKNYAINSVLGVTSLVADQRFEKEYRDDPVTVITHQKVKRKPKIIFDSTDLLETKTMRIDQVEGCGEANGGYADLLVIVYSAANNFEARAAIRDTWGQFAVERGAYFYFLLGSTDDSSLQARVEFENQTHNDILQGTFYDSYYNLTLKTISMMYWVANRCSNIRYVLKVDDDMMLNMQHICDFAEINPNFHRVIIGKLARKWKPHRDKRSKWYVPFKAYAGQYFPSFVTGPAYFFTGDAARPLYETSVNKTMFPLYLEDVYMTGIVAEKASIRRFNHSLMRNTHVPNLNACIFGKVMTSHKYTPDEIRTIWHGVYTHKCPLTEAKKSPTSNQQKTTKTAKVRRSSQT